MRVVLLLVVSVIVMTQSLGVLVSHTHIDAIGDAGQHLHSYVADADGHNGHPQDATPTEDEHRSEQPTARLSGLILLFALAFVAVMRSHRSADQSIRLVGHGLRAVHPARRHPARLALLSILRV